MFARLCVVYMCVRLMYYNTCFNNLIVNILITPKTSIGYVLVIGIRHCRIRHYDNTSQHPVRLGDIRQLFSCVFTSEYQIHHYSYY